MLYRGYGRKRTSEFKKKQKTRHSSTDVDDAADKKQFVWTTPVNIVRDIKN